jgi:hypothetical protein
METIFTNIYEKKLWGDGEFNSGSGSEIFYNKDTYIPFLKKFILDNSIKSVVDLGCGNFRCGPLVYDDLDISYTGYDTYKKLIDYNSNQYSLTKYNFVHLDFCNFKEQIIDGDLCILKDVLQHWSLDSIYSFLDYLTETKKFKYILLCNCCSQSVDNTNIQSGDFHFLSSDYLPLKKYNIKKLYNYTIKLNENGGNFYKEISVIEA